MRVLEYYFFVMSHNRTIAEKVELVMKHWGDHVKREGQSSLVVIQPEGRARNHALACDKVKSDKYVLVHSRVLDKDGKSVELIRFPYYNVEAVCDDRASGALGFTGDREKIAQVSKLLFAQQ